MVTKRDINFFRSEYQRKGFGTVDSISHVFGWASHEKFYEQMVSWHSFVDSIFPDYFPFNMVQGFLQTVIDNVYYHQAQVHYDKGVDCGRQLVGKAEEIVNWAQNRINSAISEANNYIETRMIKPINDYINNTLKPQLADAQSKINGMLSQLSGFDTRINGLSGSVDSIQNSVKNFQTRLEGFNTSLNDLSSRANGFDNKLKDFNTTLNDLTGKAQSLDAALKDAQNKLVNYKALIDALDRRVAALEGKAPTEKPAEEKLLFPSLQKIIKL